MSKWLILDSCIISLGVIFNLVSMVVKLQLVSTQDSSLTSEVNPQGSVGTLSTLFVVLKKMFLLKSSIDKSYWKFSCFYTHALLDIYNTSQQSTEADRTVLLLLH